MSRHTCHAFRCTVTCPPARLMCPKHWRLVPKLRQAAVWANYRTGQEVDKEPTAAYVLAAQRAVNAVAEVEGHATPYPRVEATP